MSTVANATFEFTSWDEQPYNEAEGQPQLSRASVANVFKGDIEGESKLEYLMSYTQNGGASFVGHERVTGRIGDRSGSFVLQHEGVFENGAARGNLTIVPGTATGQLTGLRGHGSYIATDVRPTPFTLEYEFT